MWLPYGVLNYCNNLDGVMRRALNSEEVERVRD